MKEDLQRHDGSSIIKVKVGNNAFNTKARYDIGRKFKERALVDHRYTDNVEAALAFRSVDQTGSNATLKFPEKLFRLISDASKSTRIYFVSDSGKFQDKKGVEARNIIAWQEHGRSFIIRHQKLFEKYLLGKYFKTTKYRTFQRQLNMYGFKRLTNERERGSYYHEKFLRSFPNLCSMINRIQVKGNGFKPISIAALEPDFYSMPYLPLVQPCHEKGSETTKLISNHETYHIEDEKLLEKKSVDKEDLNRHQHVGMDDGMDFHYETKDGANISYSFQETLSDKNCFGKASVKENLVDPLKKSNRSFDEVVGGGIGEKLYPEFVMNGQLHNVQIGQSRDFITSDYSHSNMYVDEGKSAIQFVDHQRVPLKSDFQYAHLEIDNGADRNFQQHVKNVSFLDSSFHRQTELEIMSCFNYEPVSRDVNV